MQNSRSDRHQPVIRAVATTEVAQPLTMLTAQAATAVRELGSSVDDACAAAAVTASRGM